MKSLLNWIEDRTGLIGAARCCLDVPVPGGASPAKVLPCTILFAFIVQAVTGFFIWMYYSPSAQTAWESVYFLQHEVSGGWLLRSIHHYSAQVMLVLIGIYVVQMICRGSYRAPREFVFWIAVLMGICCLCLMLTGDLLAWDQNSHGATQVRVNFLTLLPLIGGDAYKLAAGGPAFGHLTLTRFLALHIGVFAGGLLALLILHGVLSRRITAAEAERLSSAPPLWPNQAALNAVACAVILIVVLLLCGRHEVGLGAPADPDPANFFAAARPEWAFLGLYEFSHLFPGELMILPIFVIPGILVCTVLAMPWIGRSRVGQLFNVGFTFFMLVALTGLSVKSVVHDLHNEGHQAALSEAAHEADRVVELARGPQGIPATGALTLLRNDPKTQGPKLFKLHCASCHDHADAEGNGILAEESSAPNLHEFASREWLAGLLDPEQIKGPEYFGNTKLKGGDMAGFVDDLLSDLEDDEQEEVQKIVMALSAQAELKSQRELDAKDAAAIEEGRSLLMDDYGCADCHKFHDKGQLGGAPILTGYGSRQWIVGIIGNPADKQFYGKRNDRMPAYAELPDDSAENILSAKQIGLLTDWLRGEWYEAGK